MTFKRPSLALIMWATGVSLSLLSMGGTENYDYNPRVYGTFLRAPTTSEGILSPEQQM